MSWRTNFSKSIPLVVENQLVGDKLTRIVTVNYFDTNIDTAVTFSSNKATQNNTLTVESNMILTKSILGK